MRAYIKNKISALHLDNVVNCIRNPKKIDVWEYSKDETNMSTFLKSSQFST
jgi:hypothetical protein